MKYGNVTLGQVEAVWNKLGGEEGVRQFLAGETIVRPFVQSDFPIWRKIAIGGKSKDELLAGFEGSGCFVRDWAKDMMSRPAFTTATEVQTLNLVRAKVRDLGFIKNPTMNEIWSRAKELGLKLCPAEAGPRLRLDFSDQPNGDICSIAMEQIADSDGFPRVFGVRRSGVGERWLDGNYALPDDTRHLEDELVFCK